MAIFDVLQVLPELLTLQWLPEVGHFLENGLKCIDVVAFAFEQGNRLLDVLKVLQRNALVLVNCIARSTQCWRVYGDWRQVFDLKIVDVQIFQNALILRKDV